MVLADAMAHGQHLARGRGHIGRARFVGHAVTDGVGERQDVVRRRQPAGQDLTHEGHDRVVGLRQWRLHTIGMHGQTAVLAAQQAARKRRDLHLPDHAQLDVGMRVVQRQPRRALRCASAARAGARRRAASAAASECCR
ncbi:hypothetical protein G6F59_015976 [Rhizopus arrhizus]|nr:hypothetical protein G6F59_015976 [Rhizopus arrhizus]